MDIINSLIDTYNLPLLTAFLLGVLTSISPCPLASNITAIAFISKEIKSAKDSIINGLFYTLGRMLSYSLLAMIVYFGVSAFSIASIFEGWGDKVLGPILIVISLIMFDVIKINFSFGQAEEKEKFKKWLVSKGYFGSFFLGVLLALAFCPYSGALFFGALLPLILNSPEGLLLPSVFGLGTGLPVIFFAYLIVFSAKKIGRAFDIVKKVEKIIRELVATVFMVTGLYYLFILIKYLFIIY